MTLKKKNNSGPFSHFADKYVERGFSVIPLRKNDKTPAIKEWTTYCKQLPNKNDILRWKEQYSFANIGLCCGPSSGIVVFDLDLNLKKKSHRVIFDRLKKHIPHSPIEKVGEKGFSRFYKYNGISSKTFSIKNAEGKRINVADFLSTGRQTVLPPSIHPASMKPYIWSDSESNLLKIDIKDLPEFSSENLDKIESILKKLEVDKITDETSTGRNNILKEMAVAAIHNNKSDKEIAVEILKYDKLNNTSPLFSDKTDLQMRNNDPKENALRFVSSIRKSLGVRVKSKELKPMSIAQLYSEKIKPPEWLVHELLPVGSLSMIAGKPKAGKSTMARQLLACVDEGVEFLGRKTKHGPSLYLAIEEIISQLKVDFQALGVRKSSKIKLIPGDLYDPKLKKLKLLIKQHRPLLVVIDTLFRFIRVKDNNAYNDVIKALTPLLHLARETGTHILCVHHASKGISNGTDSILGSTGIFGSVDTAILVAESGKQRFISSKQRYGTPLSETTLIFNSENKRVSLGGSKLQSETSRISRSILQALKSQKKPLIEKEIEKLISGKTTYFRAALRKLVKKGKIIKSGAGTKGNPFKYVLAK